MFIDQPIVPVGRVFVNSPGERDSIPGQVIPKIQKWHLTPPCLILTIIRDVSKVKLSNPVERSSAITYSLLQKLLKRDTSGLQVYFFTYFYLYKKDLFFMKDNYVVWSKCLFIFIFHSLLGYRRVMLDNFCSWHLSEQKKVTWSHKVTRFKETVITEGNGICDSCSNTERDCLRFTLY